MPIRLDYEESCKRLQPKYLDSGIIPKKLPRARRFSDEGGISFFRTWMEGDDLGDLSLPRSFFGKSKIEDVSFHNSDLGESILCWNDFLGVDFSEASLVGSDLRASLYVRVDFSCADLRSADLRLSDFEGCSFEGANMAGCVLTRRIGSQAILSPKQQEEIAWVEDEGAEPEGG